MTILDGLHTKFHLTLRTSTTPSNITLQVSLNTAIYIHQESTDMAQNNTIVAYALMPAAGAQHLGVTRGPDLSPSAFDSGWGAFSSTP